MDIKLITSIRSIDNYIKKETVKIHRKVLEALSKLGEECVIEARDRSAKESWYDQTGNLRSSIGYIVVHNGTIVQSSSFAVIKDGSQGAKEGEELANTLAQTFNKGYALIVVAGMKYAVYVEAMDNKAVLTSAELYARGELPKMIKQLERYKSK